MIAVGLTIASVLSFVTRPFYALAPGSVRDTASRIDVQGTDVFIPEGQIGFLTVSLRERVTLFEYFRAELDPTIDLVAEEIINGDRTSEEKRAEDRLRMQESKDVATIVALTHLGYDVETVGLGVQVVELTECMPAEDVLNPGDLIVGFEGEPVEFSRDLTEPLGELAPGDVVTLEVDRIANNELELVELELGSSADPCLAEEFRDPIDEQRAMVGIRLQQMFDYELPVDVTIDTDRVGGPSAGLAFALSVIDVLTEGELTGGADVATTGTIAIDGTVGRVGGVKQKTVAAREAGVELMLVPPGEAEEAADYAGDMRVVEVETLEDALVALGELGGNVDDLPSLPEQAAGE